MARRGGWLAAAVVALAVAPAARGEAPGCEITVELRPPPGQAVQDRTILLLDRSGFPIARTVTKKGRAQFCGVERRWFHAVRVGELGNAGDCRTKIVENIRLSESKPRVHLVFDMEQFCGEPPTYGSNREVCTSRIYVRDATTNSPIFSVKVTNTDGKEPVKQAGDYFTLEFFDDPSRLLRVEAPGYHAVERILRCVEAGRAEAVVRLTRVP